MAYPYIPSGGLIKTAFDQFRKSMPARVDADTLKKLSIASSNETAIINIMKFIGLLSDENKKTSDGTKVFTQHDDEKYQDALARQVKPAYSELFELHGDDAWSLDRDSLIGFFRSSDETSAVTGKRQAITFETLAALSGMSDKEVGVRGPNKRKEAPSKKTTPPVAKQKPKTRKMGDDQAREREFLGETPFGLSVRIELNLPANASAESYDNIFKSIRKNLLDGKA